MDGEDSARREEVAPPVDELAQHLRDFGAPDSEIERMLASGDLQRAIVETLTLHSTAGRTVTPAEIEAGGGPPGARLDELIGGFGLPPPEREEPAFTPQEAEALIELWQSRDVWPFELAVQLSRMYGRLLARIAQASIQLWVSAV